MMNKKSRWVKLGAALWLAVGVSLGAAGTLTQATKEAPWENSHGMKFVPVAGTAALFCIWHTRVQDFASFVKATAGTAPVAGGKEVAKDWQTPEAGKPSNFHAALKKMEQYNQGPTEPACNVSWEEAGAFCQWLTKKERAAGALPANMEYRLPTDAEWSVAVGLGPEPGQTIYEKNRKITEVYPWGTEKMPAKAAGNYFGEEHRTSPYQKFVAPNDGFMFTSPVGSFPPNAFGLYDMGGNVWQFCRDEFDPPLPARVLRGGAWCTTDLKYMLSGRRTAAPPDSHYNFNGFRCVIAPVAASASQ